MINLIFFSDIFTYTNVIWNIKKQFPDKYNIIMNDVLKVSIEDLVVNNTAPFVQVPVAIIQLLFSKNNPITI